MPRFAESDRGRPRIVRTRQRGGGRRTFFASHHGLSTIVTCLLAAALLSGCCSLAGRGPVAENVVSCRHLSQGGLYAIEKQDWARAESLCREAVAACPVDERARRLFAEALWQRGKHADAVTQMTEAVRLSGGDPQAIVRLGEMYLHQSDLDQAQHWADRAVEANPQLSSAWALRGDALLRRGNQMDALADYHRALTLQPDFPHVQLQIADIYRQQNRPQRALATLEAMTGEMTAEEVPAPWLYRKGIALKALGRYEEAAETLTAATLREKPSVEMLYELSEAELLAGRPVSARLAAHRALVLAPDHQASRSLLARIEQEQERMAVSVRPTAPH